MAKEAYRPWCHKITESCPVSEASIKPANLRTTGSKHIYFENISLESRKRTLEEARVKRYGDRNKSPKAV